MAIASSCHVAVTVCQYEGCIILSGTAEAGTETNDWVCFLTSFNRIGKRQPYKHKYKFIIAIIAKQTGVTLAM